MNTEKFESSEGCSIEERNHKLITFLAIISYIFIVVYFLSSIIYFIYDNDGSGVFLGMLNIIIVIVSLIITIIAQKKKKNINLILLIILPFLQYLCSYIIVDKYRIGWYTTDNMINLNNSNIEELRSPSIKKRRNNNFWKRFPFQKRPKEVTATSRKSKSRSTSMSF